MLGVFKKFCFTPSLVPSVAAASLFALMIYLGHWQQGRAAEKHALQAQFDDQSQQSPILLDARTRERSLRYRRAVAEGAWQGNLQLFIDNKVENAQAGYHVITPLKLADTESYLLVNRGWIARSTSYPEPPEVSVPAGRVKVSGTLSIPTSRFVELSNVTVENRVWQNLTVERYQLATGLDVLPFVLLAKDSYTPLKTVSEKPNARADKHTEYMLTWYSLAIAVVVIWVVTNLHISTNRPLA